MLIRVSISVFICACLVSLAFKRPLPATSAPNDREATVIVIDAQTGRVIKAINYDPASRDAFPPGSTIKPFTALTALRAGLVDENSRIRCREEYRHDDRVEVCSHPRDLPPLNPAEAIAYSCNYYFAKTGERIKADQLAQTLTEFGFDRIVRARWQPTSAIGEGEFVQVTPIQLLRAYAALFNGGRLFDSESGPAQIHVSESERAILLAGMRGAVKFGTAANADLDSSSNYVIGKTGTATQLKGFRSQGWFVGIAFASNKPPDPENARFAVVVYLKKGHGSEAAKVAARLIKQISSDTATASVPSQPSASSVSIGGHRMPLEDYVAHVISAEASTDDEPESLKALAVTVRTYALKNLGHQAQGYDFCATTHCQRFEATAPSQSALNAARDTSGLVIQSEERAIADSYFSASCGGMTANLQTLWGAPTPKYLAGVRDDYCKAGSHSRWTDVISREQMLKALRSDPRTDVGETIRELSVAKRDQTGRAELVSLFGSQKRLISGWEFKLIVGRALGWNVLKSSRFAVSRSGSAFVFHGTGFGHGLGLCQEGAHEMGQRGYNYSQILAKYFPGTTVGPQVTRITSQRSAHFSMSGERVDAAETQRLLSLLESSRTALIRRLSSADMEFQFPNVEIVFNKTTGDFVGRTGMPAWAAAATRNNRIELQPLALLKQRGILETTLRHELVHVMVDTIGNGQTPRWLAEGIALYVAGEGPLIEHYGKGPAMAPGDLEQRLATARSPEEMKATYAAAYQRVRDLVRTEGENKLWRRVAQRSYDVRASGR